MKKVDNPYANGGWYQDGEIMPDTTLRTILSK